MVLRCFEDDNITHVEGSIDPVRDAETVMTELLLSDLESLERRIEPIEKRARQGEKEAKQQFGVMEPVLTALREGLPARTVEVPPSETAIFQQLNLLTAKPILYACNVEEESAADGNRHSQAVEVMAAKEGAESVVVSAAIEAEVSQLGDAEEKAEYLESLGLSEAGLDRVIRAGYKLLKLLTYFTSGPKESRAWTVSDGTTAAPAAGKIHTDFERGFIAAETISFDDFIECNGEQGAKDTGKMRLEGRDYTVQDADIILFRFNV
jgi:GTP-binding protein YchF